MLRNGSSGSLTTTSTPDERGTRGIRRLRLTLRPDDISVGQYDATKSPAQSEGKMGNESWMKKNGFMQRERPAGRESPVEEKHSCSVSNGGVAERETLPGLRVYGVVQHSGDQQQQEVMAREWPGNHLKEEMRYIKEVRDSLEKVRERMYGQFGGMQQSIQKLSQELRVANSHKRYLEGEVRTRKAAFESFDQMNSSLISANIDLQKSLLESCQGRVGNREEMKAMRSSFEKTEENLREREKQLAVANAENRMLKQQMQSSQEDNARALQEMSAKLQRQYEEKLQEEQRKHRQEVEALKAQLEEYVRRLDEAEENMRIAEAKIAERDQRIIEVERLLDCMAQEKGQLTKKLCECEQRLRSLDQDQIDSGGVKKAEQLQVQREASELKERIKHLNDMVFSQQRKVKSMIEEVTTLRADVARKDMYISELLDRLAIVECEKTNENKPITKEIGVGCDLPVSFPEPQPYEAPSVPRRSSRLDNSLLRYSPLQYSSMLTLHTRNPASSPGREKLTPSTSSSTELTASTSTSTSSTVSSAVSTSTSSSMFSSTSSSASSSASSSMFSSTSSSKSKIYTPFMRLMEISANLKVD
ncbi:myocardial zonula adherens protein isoform X2 [Trichomycterus rosablanca]|uniref:myocardial zonula adherens protein isoform X2 n=1 Tax=Trichomycterus rosablanca TaxID=2290929 RepID=UPI002F356FB2